MQWSICVQFQPISSIKRKENVATEQGEEDLCSSIVKKDFTIAIVRFRCSLNAQVFSSLGQKK
jgi:hypothetical protein